MIVDPEYRQGSLCETYGHSWRETNQQGKFQCRTCRAVAYCPTCLLVVPKGALTARCERHQEEQRHG